MIKIRITDICTIDFLQRMDEAIKEGAITHSKHWFGELKNHQAIEEMYVPLIRTHNPTDCEVTISLTKSTCLEGGLLMYPHSINEIDVSILRESSILPFVILRDIWIKRDPMHKESVVAFGSSLWAERVKYKYQTPRFVL